MSAVSGSSARHALDRSADPPVMVAIALLVALFATATISNVIPVPPLVFRALLLAAALVAAWNRTAAVVLLLCVPILGVQWTSGQFSLPIAALLGEGVRWLRGPRRIPTSITILDAGVAAYALAVALSIPFSGDMPAVSLVSTHLALFVAGYFLISRALASSATFEIATGALAIVGAYSAVIGIGQASVPGFFAGFPSPAATGLPFPAFRATGFFENPNTFAVTLVVCAAIALDRVAVARRRRARIAWAACALLLVLGVEMSETRAAYVGLAVVLGALALVRFRGLRESLRIAVPVGVLGIVTIVVTGAASRVSSLARWMSDPASMDRVYLARASARMFADHLPFGIGVGRFAAEYPAYADPRVDVSPVTDPHQSPVAMLAETGVAGLVAETVVVAALGWALVRARRRANDRGLSAAGPAAGAAVVAMSAFNTAHYLHIFWIGLALAGAFMLAGDVALLQLGGPAGPTDATP